MSEPIDNAARFSFGTMPYLAFAVVWLSAFALLVFRAGAVPWGMLASTLVIALLCWLTCRAFRDGNADAGAAASAENGERRQASIRLQLGFLFAVILASGIDGLVFHGVLGHGLPPWHEIRALLGAAGEGLFGAATFVINPIIYFLVPFLLLIWLGVRPAEIGFGRGRQVLAVTALWCLIPLLLVFRALVDGSLGVAALFVLILSNLLQNGPFEEFLFRAALQTRLRKIVGGNWAIVSQAIVFAAWHLGLGFTMTNGGDFLLSTATVIAYLAPLGVAFGIIYARTGNLVAGSAAHVSINLLGS